MSVPVNEYFNTYLMANENSAKYNCKVCIIFMARSEGEIDSLLWPCWANPSKSWFILIKVFARCLLQSKIDQVAWRQGWRLSSVIIIRVWNIFNIRSDKLDRKDGY